ncbi:MAG: hypothetical protein V1875_06985 [Candidatus Altiarchaeota archaeon]
MASVAVTLTLSEDEKSALERLRWVNWSEVGREEVEREFRRQKALAKLSESLKDSELTDEDCLILGRQLKKDLAKRLKREGRL